MKAEQLRELSDDDLRHRLEENRQKLFNLRFQVATRKTKNVEEISATKKDIARILTILRERELITRYVGEEAVESLPAASAGSTERSQALRPGLLGRLRRTGSR